MRKTIIAAALTVGVVTVRIAAQAIRTVIPMHRVIPTSCRRSSNKQQSCKASRPRSKGCYRRSQMSPLRQDSIRLVIPA
jgi:hypothetical protein